MYLKHFVFTEVGVKSVNALMHGLTTTTCSNIPQKHHYITYCTETSSKTAASTLLNIQLPQQQHIYIYIYTVYISATHSSYALFSKKICSNILRSDRRNGHRTHINSNKIYGTDSFERFLGLGLYFSVYF